MDKPRFEILFLDTVDHVYRLYMKQCNNNEQRVHELVWDMYIRTYKEYPRYNFEIGMEPAVWIEAQALSYLESKLGLHEDLINFEEAGWNNDLFAPQQFVKKLRKKLRPEVRRKVKLSLRDSGWLTSGPGSFVLSAGAVITAVAVPTVVLIMNYEPEIEEPVNSPALEEVTDPNDIPELELFSSEIISKEDEKILERILIIEDEDSEGEVDDVTSTPKPAQKRAPVVVTDPNPVVNVSESKPQTAPDPIFEDVDPVEEEEEDILEEPVNEEQHDEPVEQPIRNGGGSIQQNEIPGQDLYTEEIPL